MLLSEKSEQMRRTDFISKEGENRYNECQQSAKIGYRGI